MHATTQAVTSSGVATRRLAPAAALAALLVLGTAAPASAHERWFTENTAGGQWAFYLRPLPLAMTAAVVLVALVWRRVSHRLPRPELQVLSPAARLTP